MMKILILVCDNFSKFNNTQIIKNNKFIYNDL